MPATASSQRYRIGAVSYLNTRPLIEGLDARDDVQMLLDVPAKLLNLLTTDQCDVALLPVIDYQRAPDLIMLPGACIGADGPAMTVRLCGRVPVDQVRIIASDPESHTSNALARVLFEGRQFVDQPTGQEDAIVYIGDKVITRPPAGLPHQVDLAELWKQRTGLPFVFAAWMGRNRQTLDGLSPILNQAHACGMRAIDRIVQQHAVPRGWPADLGRSYLTEFLKFDLDLSPASPQRKAIELFHELAAKAGVIPSPVRLL